MTGGEGAAVGLPLVGVEEGPLTGGSFGGETEGTGEEAEVDIPDDLLELTSSSGTVEDGLTGGVGDKGSPETGREGSTAPSEETGDWVGRVAAGSVGDKKTVEMTVTVTGPPAAGSVSCGIPSEVEEGGSKPSSPVGSAGLGIPVTGSSTEELEGTSGTVEEGSTDGVEDGSTGGVVEDGSTGVAGGSTPVGSAPVGFLGLPLERTTLGLSNSTSLREMSGCPPPMV